MSEYDKVIEYLDKQVFVPKKIETTSGHLLNKSLIKLYEQAEHANKEKDYNTAYIFFKRWLNTVQSLQGRNLDSDILKNQMQNVNDKLKEIYKYFDLAYRCNNSSTSTNPSKIKYGPDIIFNLPNTPTDEPEDKEIDEITCSQLYDILIKKNSNQRILLIDLRKEDDYAKFKISFQDNLIHIPEEKIQSGQSASYYDTILSDEDAVNQLNRRISNYMDIVLIDSNSSYDTMKINSFISVFKECLEKHYENTTIKSIVVLKGGFEKWLNTYPNAVAVSQTRGSFISNENKGNNRQFLHSNLKELRVVVEKLPPQKPRIDRSNKPSSNTKLIDNCKLHDTNLNDMKSSLKEISSFDSIPYSKNELDVWEKESLYTKLKYNEQNTIPKPRMANSSVEKGVKLYPPIPSLSKSIDFQSHNTKTSSSRTPKQDLIAEKENIQEPQEKVERTKYEIPPFSPSPSILQKMDIDDQESSTQLLKCKNDNYTSTSELKRSISSPSLVQHSRPKVDRSLKPVENTNRNMTTSHSLLRDRRLEPIYASSHIYPGVTGLKNLGNSCYMNSIIQCLSNTQCLASYFNNNHYTSDLNRNTDKGITGYVAEEVAQIIRALWRGLYRSVSPHDLKVVVGQYKLQFESSDQQDSHEFLMFLLDWMHNDLKKKSKIIHDHHLSVAEKEWEKSMDGQSSIISRYFFGQLRSTIECQECGKNSTTYETFNSLTMSLPGSNKCTLDDCVKKFLSGQHVSGWKCPSCNVPRDGIKKFDIAKLPLIIVIHLNRFGESGGWLEKKNTAVDFPLNNFNLRPYVVQDANGLGNSHCYNLYAMSNHYGTMEGGHYTAFCKSHTSKKWYKYDDQAVSEVPQETVKRQSNSAYLLFYTSAESESSYLNS